MSDNPLEMTPERQGRIDARATQMWEADGSPAGGLDEYRERADELLRMEDAGNPGQLPNPMTQDEPMPGVTVEEASIQDNLGEFPGASGKADQGEFRNAPMTRDELRDEGDDVGEPNPGGQPVADEPT